MLAGCCTANVAEGTAAEAKGLRGATPDRNDAGGEVCCSGSCCCCCCGIDPRPGEPGPVLEGGRSACWATAEVALAACTAVVAPIPSRPPIALLSAPPPISGRATTEVAAVAPVTAAAVGAEAVTAGTAVEVAMVAAEVEGRPEHKPCRRATDPPRNLTLSGVRTSAPRRTNTSVTHTCTRHGQGDNGLSMRARTHLATHSKLTLDPAKKACSDGRSPLAGSLLTCAW